MSVSSGFCPAVSVSAALFPSLKLSSLLLGLFFLRSLRGPSRISTIHHVKSLTKLDDNLSFSVFLLLILSLLPLCVSPCLYVQERERERGRERERFSSLFMYMRACVCLSVCVCTCVYARARACVCVRASACAHACVCVCASVRVLGFFLCVCWLFFVRASVFSDQFHSPLIYPVKSALHTAVFCYSAARFRQPCPVPMPDNSRNFDVICEGFRATDQVHVQIKWNHGSYEDFCMRAPCFKCINHFPNISELFRSSGNQVTIRIKSVTRNGWEFGSVTCGTHRDILKSKPTSCDLEVDCEYGNYTFLLPYLIMDQRLLFSVCVYASLFLSLPLLSFCLL